MKDKNISDALKLEYQGHKLEFVPDPELFSPGQIDRGTLAMLSEVSFEKGMKVLDLGCGYGVVGICAAAVAGPENIIMTDVNERAVELSRLNFKRNIITEAMTDQTPGSEVMKGEDAGIFVSDGLKDIKDRDFDIILSNPPYHTDFSVAKEFIEDGYRALKTGGRMVMVTKRRTWYENKLKSVFGGVRVVEKDGYCVFISEKRENRPAPEKAKSGGMSKKLQKKMQNRVTKHSKRKNQV